MAIQRIAIISVHASPLAKMGGRKTGGMNVYIRKLAQEFGRRGLLVDIYTRRTASDQPCVDTSLGENVRVIQVTAGGIQPLGPDDIYPHVCEFSAGVMAFTTRHNIRYDLIYSHYWLSGCVANCLKTTWGIPFIQMFHTLGQMKNRITPASSAPNQRISSEMQIVQWADGIVAATPAEQAQLRWLYRASRRKITIVSPGVDLNQFRPLPHQVAKTQLGLPKNTNLLLFVGRIEPLKGVDTAIEALALIQDEQPQLLEQVKFMIIGGNTDDPTDTEMNYLQDLVNRFSLGHVIEFVGAKDQTQLPVYYAAATAVVMPSDYESFGMVALEAMASGTPVIATEVGGLAFLIEDGVSGFLVPVRDPEALAHRMATLLYNPEQLQQMRVAASDQAQQYAWSTIADKLLEMFSQMRARQRVNHHTH